MRALAHGAGSPPDKQARIAGLHPTLGAAFTLGAVHLRLMGGHPTGKQAPLMDWRLLNGAAFTHKAVGLPLAQGNGYK